MQTWLTSLIDAAREGYSKIKDPAKPDMIHFDFAFPCQFDVFSIDYPRVNLLLKTHDGKRPDKEIRIHGPYHSTEFIQRVTEDIKLLGWVGPKVGRTHEWLVEMEMDDEYSENDVIEGCFADFVALRLNEMMNIARDNLFIASASPLSLHFLEIDVPFLRFEEEYPVFAILEGNFFELDYNEFAQGAVNFVLGVQKYFASMAQTNAADTESNVTKKSRINKDWKKKEKVVRGYGAYFFPPVRIGEVEESTFEDILKGTVDPYVARLFNISSEYKFSPVLRTPLNGEDHTVINLESIDGFAHVWVTRGGFIFIETNSIKQAKDMFNIIMAVASCFLPKEEALMVHSVRVNDILYAKPKDGILPIPFGDTESVLTERTIVNGLLRRENMLHYVGVRQRSTDWMKKVLKYAFEINKNDRRLGEVCRLWIDALTLLYEGQYSQSFITGWIILESYIVDLYVSVTGNMIPGDFRPNMLSELRSKNRITEERDGIIRRLYSKRKNFVHRGEEIGQESCYQCIDISQQILIERFSRIRNR